MEDGNDDESEEEDESESFDDQDCIDPQSLTKNMEEYLSSKGFLAIERIKDIIAEIMSSC